MTFYLLIQNIIYKLWIVDELKLCFLKIIVGREQFFQIVLKMFNCGMVHINKSYEWIRNHERFSHKLPRWFNWKLTNRKAYRIVGWKPSLFRWFTRKIVLKISDHIHSFIHPWLYTSLVVPATIHKIRYSLKAIFYNSNNSFTSAFDGTGNELLYSGIFSVLG